MRSLSRRLLFRVFAPEGEILSFKQPLESIQRKGGSIGAQPAVLGAANETKQCRCLHYSLASCNSLTKQVICQPVNGLLL